MPQPMLASRLPVSPLQPFGLRLESKRQHQDLKTEEATMRNRRRALYAVFLTIFAMSAANATLPQKQKEEPKAQDLIKEVRHQLVLLPYYSVFDNLAFKVEGSKVTLVGQVVRPTLKSDAENV